VSGSSNPVRGAVLLYGLLTVGAVTWVLADRGTADLWRHPAPLVQLPFALGFVGGLVAGVVLGLIVARLTRVAVRRTRWGAGLHTEFQALLGPLPDGDILLLALLSAVAEECFFRGALQPTVGLVAASLVFGAMHVPVNKRFVVWTLEATVMGFVLGGLFVATGQLAAPIAAHFTINYENLHFVRRYRPA
jgi:membrane protease YdiL (CAAX protease family)